MHSVSRFHCKVAYSNPLTKRNKLGSASHLRLGCISKKLQEFLKNKVAYSSHIKFKKLLRLEAPNGFSSFFLKKLHYMGMVLVSTGWEAQELGSIPSISKSSNKLPPRGEDWKLE